MPSNQDPTGLNKEPSEDDEQDFHDCVLAADPTKMNGQNNYCSVLGESSAVPDTTETSRGKILRSLSRRRSAVTESLPETPQGWAALTSVLAALTLGYELNLQKQLTCPPTVYGQCHQGPMKEIFQRLTASPNSLLTRNIHPSLFVGTRGVVASTAAYALAGPSIDNHVRFRQILRMSQDGSQVALEWELPKSDDGLSPEERENECLRGTIRQPVVLILHGINNDSSFGYIRSLMRACTDRGWIAVGLNFRGCGGADLTTPRGYTGAYTGDMRCVVQNITARFEGDATLFLVGNSLGANLITKYLGEEGLSETLPKGVAGGISLGNPLHIHGDNIHFPWDVLLALGVKKTLLEHWKSFKPMKCPEYQAVLRRTMMAPTIQQLDEAICPIQINNNPVYPYETRIGYENAEAYWKDASSYRYIRHVSVPLLLLTSEDDFLVRGSVKKMYYPLANPNVLVVNTKCGGHLGWQESPPDTGSTFGFGTSWADTATTEFIAAILEGQTTASASYNSDNKSKLKAEALAAASKLQPRL
jgi:predicted alpha/beta-fold hydrolase